jgi:hypothetical protein
MEGYKARTSAASVHLLVVERVSIYSNTCIRFAFLIFDSGTQWASSSMRSAEPLVDQALAGCRGLWHLRLASWACTYCSSNLDGLWSNLSS